MTNRKKLRNESWVWKYNKKNWKHIKFLKNSDTARSKDNRPRRPFVMEQYQDLLGHIKGTRAISHLWSLLLKICWGVNFNWKYLLPFILREHTCSTVTRKSSTEIHCGEQNEGGNFENCVEEEEIYQAEQESKYWSWLCSWGSFFPLLQP